MTYTRKKLEHRVAGALESCASSFKPRQSGGGWDLSLVNGKALPVTARLQNDWLLLDAPVSDRVAREDLWNLLLLNATLPGLSKFVLTPRRAIHIRADVPLPEEDDRIDSEDQLETNLTTRLGEACASLKMAYGVFRGEKMVQPSISQIDTEGKNECRLEEFRRRCAEAEWPLNERAEGRIVFELDVRDSFYQASVEQEGAGAHFTVEIARAEVLSEPGRQALSMLLLRTGALVKLARPSIEEREDHLAARFEVRFTTMPTAVEMTHALGSLSVACAMSGREARAIRDETIARDYLATVKLHALRPLVRGD